jgi:hypothetical protein
MIDKAEAVLQQIRQRQALEKWERLKTPDRRDGILDDFNRDNTPDVTTFGGNLVMSLLKDINGRSGFVKKRDIVVQGIFAGICRYVKSSVRRKVGINLFLAARNMP